MEMIALAPPKSSLTHKPKKLDECNSCNGTINAQTGECRCSD